MTWGRQDNTQIGGKWLFNSQIALLRCNSHIVQFIHWRFINQWFLVYLKISATIIIVNFRIFLSKRENNLHILWFSRLPPAHITLSLPVTNTQATTNILCLYRFWAFIWMESCGMWPFCNGLLSFSMTFSRFTQSLSCRSTPFLFMTNWYLIV